MVIVPLHLVFVALWRKYYIGDVPKSSTSKNTHLYFTNHLDFWYFYFSNDTSNAKNVSVVYRVSTCGTAVTQVSILEWQALLGRPRFKLQIIPITNNNNVCFFRKNCTYIDNPGYPGTYSTTGDCSYTVSRCQDGMKFSKNLQTTFHKLSKTPQSILHCQFHFTIPFKIFAKSVWISSRQTYNSLVHQPPSTHMQHVLVCSWT